MDQFSRQGIMSLRAIDANFNRAREALRVLEDVARFERENLGLTEALKAIRHRVDELARPYSAALLAARDSGDIGRDSDRPGARDVVAANFKRAEEALRSIEEQTRGRWIPVSRGAHTLRFRLYALEPRMRGPRGGVDSARLYVLLDSSVARGSIEKATIEAIRGGADLLQLREQAGDRRILRLARRLAETAHAHGILFVVNDRADIAVASGADGVHVGAEDLSIPAARDVVGEYRLVGATTHSLAEAREAVRLGADYISVGPMFSSPTKPELAARGFDYLSAAKKLGVPHFCIGGITRANVEPRMERVAVCSGVIAQPAIAASAREIRRKLVTFERDVARKAP